MPGLLLIGGTALRNNKSLWAHYFSDEQIGHWLLLSDCQLSLVMALLLFLLIFIYLFVITLLVFDLVCLSLSVCQIFLK